MATTGVLPLSAAYIKWRSGQFDLEDVTTLQLNGLAILSLSVPSSVLFRCVNLTSLSLRKNELRSLDGIEALPLLTHLDLTDNKISTLHSLSFLTALSELHLANNSIADLKQLDHLKPLSELRSLSLGPGRGNAIATGDRHFIAVPEMLPQVLVLDGQSVKVAKALRAAQEALHKAGRKERPSIEKGGWLSDGPDASTEAATTSIVEARADTVAARALLKDCAAAVTAAEETLQQLLKSPV